MPRPRAENSTRISMLIPNQDLEWYRDRAHSSDRPYSELMRDALRRYREATIRKEKAQEAGE